MMGFSFVDLEGNVDFQLLTPGCRDLVAKSSETPDLLAQCSGTVCPGLLGEKKGENSFCSLAACSSAEGNSLSLSLTEVHVGRWEPSVTICWHFLNSSRERA